MKSSLVFCLLFPVLNIAAMETGQSRINQISSEILNYNGLECCEFSSKGGLYLGSAGMCAGICARGLQKYHLGMPITNTEVAVVSGYLIGTGIWSAINCFITQANEPRRARREKYLAQLRVAKEV